MPGPSTKQKTKPSNPEYLVGRGHKTKLLTANNNHNNHNNNNINKNELLPHILLSFDNTLVMIPYEQFYPKHWPMTPFHHGEIQLQKQEGVHELVMSYAPKFVKPYLVDHQREFFEAQPFLVVAARDKEGNMWATLISSSSGSADITTSPDPVTLEIAGVPVPQDALAGAFREGTDLGILGIEFATKQRHRVNGRIKKIKDSHRFTFKVDQCFGNCPQYIIPRKWCTAAAQRGQGNSSPQKQIVGTGCASERSTFLNEDQIGRISVAQTIFVATGYRGEGEDVRYGNDASHRGGTAGFLLVKDMKTLLLPEFSGNNHFNSLGNLLLDNRMGITIPSYEDGGMLQLSGRAAVDFDHERARNTFPAARRIITFHIEHVNDVPSGSLPVRWSFESAAQSRQVQVRDIVQESTNVKSFYLESLPQEKLSLWEFTAGQHLPIQLLTPSGEILRTYSLSGSPTKQGEFRISVKREPFGQASTFLHDQVAVGYTLQVSRPAGDFMLPKKHDNQDDDLERPLVLLSSGIGITPILSMLHQYVESLETTHRNVYWVHGTRDSEHHPFRDEVQGLVQRSKGSVKSHVVYSKPLPSDETFDTKGHVDVTLLEMLVPNLKEADVYMCGNGSFMADMQDGLELAGVDPKHIHYETF